MQNGAHKYVFECYMGTMFDIHTRMEYRLDARPDANNISEIPIEVSALTGYSLETINRLILLDGERNSRKQDVKSNVMWWVDVSSRYKRNKELNTFMKAFGIPKSTKDSHTVYGRQPMTYGNGEVVYQSMRQQYEKTNAYVGTAGILSMFVQAHYIENYGIVDRDRKFVKYMPLPRKLSKYISSRVNILLSHRTEKCFAKSKLVRRIAEDLDDLFEDANKNFDDWDVPDPRHTEAGGSSGAELPQGTIDSLQIEGPALKSSHTNKTRVNSASKFKLPLPNMGHPQNIPFLLSTDD